MPQKQKKFEALVNAYSDDLYRFAYWLCHDATVAEDLVQETFMRAWRSIDALQNEDSAKSWLITILRRENARRFERKSFQYDEFEETNIVDPTANTEHTVGQLWLHKHIQKLAPEYREPLIMQSLLGFSSEEISQQLQLNKNTVMTRLFRARQQLKDLLSGDQQAKEQRNG